MQIYKQVNIMKNVTKTHIHVQNSVKLVVQSWREADKWLADLKTVQNQMLSNIQGYNQF